MSISRHVVAPGAAPMSGPELRQTPESPPLHPEPRNRTLRQAALLLHAGDPVRVVLQPGDGTRYDLLLVPMWNVHAALWIGRDVGDFILVVNSIARHRGALSRRGDAHFGSMFDATRGDEWTARVLHWFMAHVWARIEQHRHTDPHTLAEALDVIMRQPIR